MATFPHIADEADVIAFDATQQTYEVELTVTSGKRYAFGVAALATDDGDQVTFSRDDGGGFDTIQARTLDDDNLENRTSLYFEDGVIWVADFTGTVTIRAAVTSGTMTIKGFVAREPDADSGIVEDQGTGTHCAPLACMYGGSLYTLHSEMYTSHVYLSKDGVAQGRVFDGLAADYNEHYHNGCAIVAMSAGVAVIQAGHNVEYIKLRYLPGGAIGSITSVYNAGGTGSTYTYCRAVVLSDVIYILTRGDNSGTNQHAVLLAVSDIDGTPSDTVDVVALDNGYRWYPRGMYLDTAGATPVICCAWNVRITATSDWGRIVCAIFAPDEGTVGEWYSLDGDAATVQSSLGTEASPRFTNTQATTATSSGDGIVLIGILSGAQRYLIEEMVYATTVYPESGVTAGKGKVLLFFVEAVSTSSDAYGDSELRQLIQNEGTLLVSGTDFAGVSRWSNNYRLSGWSGYRGDATPYFVITDRGCRRVTNLFGEETELYYDWCSGHEIDFLTITDPWTASIAFTLQKTTVLNSDLTAGFFSSVHGDPDSLLYQTAVNELHPTHRQQVDSTLDLTAADSTTEILTGVMRSAVGTGATRQTFTIPGLGWIPKAYRIEATPATADGTPIEDIDISLGFCDGFREFSTIGFDDDGAATTDSSRMTTSTRLLRRNNATAAVIVASQYSFVQDGVTIDFASNPATAFLVKITFFGGRDYQGYCGVATLSTLNTAVDIKAPRFQPSVVEFGTVGAADFTTVLATLSFTYGVARNTGAGTVQRSAGFRSADAAAAHRMAGRFSELYACFQAGATTAWAGEVSGWDTFGFTITARIGASSSDVAGYLAHNFSDRTTWLGTLDTPTSTGVESITTPAFEPQLFELCMSLFVNVDTDVSDTPNAGALGWHTITTDDEYSTALAGEDNSDPSDTQSASDDALYLDDHDGSSAFRGVGSLTASGSDINFSAVNGTSRKWFAWAVQQNTAAPVGKQYLLNQTVKLASSI